MIKILFQETLQIDEVIKKTNIEIQAENRNLQAINLQLHEKYHAMSLKVCTYVFNISTSF